MSRFLEMLLVLAALVGLASLYIPVQSLFPPGLWDKDLLQEVALARALVDGTNPYAVPLQSPVQTYPYPPAHPPTTGLLYIPLLPLGYEVGAVAWLFLEVLCLAAAVAMLLLAFGRPARPALVLMITLGLIAWYPVNSDLYWGQVALVQLPFVVGAWWALQTGRACLSSVLVAVCLLIKPFLWPLAALFVFRRDWKAIGCLALTLAIGFGTTAMRVGADSYRTYFTSVLPSINVAFRAYPENISLWSIGWRLFDGTGSSVVATASAPPVLWPAPNLAPVISFAVPSVFLLMSLAAVYRLRHSQFAIGLAVCAGILVSPVSWGHYLVLIIVAFPPALQESTRLAPASRLRTGLLLALAATLLIPNSGWKLIAYAVSSGSLLPGYSATVLAATAAGGPGLAVLLLFLLFWLFGERQRRTPLPTAFRPEPNQ